jgi:hypothetical protein
VLTYPAAIDTKARTVAETWGKEFEIACVCLIVVMWCRCDKLLFMSSQPHPALDVVALNISGPERYEVHYEKTVYAIGSVKHDVHAHIRQTGNRASVSAVLRGV